MSGKLFDRGDVVHCRMPHADAGDSRRYALIVGDPIENINKDYILLQITRTDHKGRTDYRLEQSNPEFGQTGLSESSTFRCHKIFVASSSMVQRRIGPVGKQTMLEVERRLKAALSLT
jgi:mRNA-degrading endonuclease toxin of MazEF toxin-antitoxin module